MPAAASPAASMKHTFRVSGHVCFPPRFEPKGPSRTITDPRKVFPLVSLGSTPEIPTKFHCYSCSHVGHVFPQAGVSVSRVGP